MCWDMFDVPNDKELSKFMIVRNNDEKTDCSSESYSLNVIATSRAHYSHAIVSYILRYDGNWEWFYS